MVSLLAEPKFSNEIGHRACRDRSEAKMTGEMRVSETRTKILQDSFVCSLSMLRSFRHSGRVNSVEESVLVGHLSE